MLPLFVFHAPVKKQRHQMERPAPKALGSSSINDQLRVEDNAHLHQLNPPYA